ncbi:response regulator transcription factor [Raoultella ornithinolytica]|nr:response regulator transcription factor [Raoultella ornithinolytica]
MDAVVYFDYLIVGRTVEILLIDDDIELSHLLSQQMALYNINLSICHVPSQALKLIYQRPFDVILLDIMLPDMNGFELCHLLRHNEHLNQKTPLIMLTARNEIVNLIAGLEAGADDYVSKPFEPRELIARISAVRRRNRTQTLLSPPVQQSVMLGPHQLSINMAQAWATVNGRPLKLTSSEMSILAKLIQIPGKVCLRTELEKQIFSDKHQTTRSIDALIYRIRVKFRDITVDEDFIYTVRSHGYMLRGELCTPQNKGLA